MGRSDLLTSVELSGPGLRKRNALDVYVPQLRRYEVQQQGPVEYKDVTTTWKGVSIAQAEEILFWNDAFKTVIEDYVSKTLTSSFFDSYPEADEWPIKECARYLTEFIVDIGSAVFHIDTQRLIESMINHFKRHAPVEFQWLAGPRPRDSVCNFLSTYEFFLAGSKAGCRFTVQLFPQYLQYSHSHEVKVQGTLTWIPPMLVFLNLQQHVTEGKEMFLCPRYSEVHLSDAYDSFELTTQHHVSSGDIKFVWDHPLQAYRAVVRLVAAEQDSPWLKSLSAYAGWQRGCQIDVTTVAVKHFPAGVRYERVMRCRIHLIVTTPTFEELRRMPAASLFARSSPLSRVPTAKPDDSFPILHRVQHHHQLGTPRSAPTLRKRDTQIRAPIPTINEPALRSSPPHHAREGTVLRKLSQNSIRVQGTAQVRYSYVDDDEEFYESPLPTEYHTGQDTLAPHTTQRRRGLSDFEREAQTTHEDVFNTYRKANDSRRTQLAKLYNATKPEMMLVPRPVTVRMMAGVEHSPLQTITNSTGSEQSDQYRQNRTPQRLEQVAPGLVATPENLDRSQHFSEHYYSYQKTPASKKRPANSPTGSFEPLDYRTAPIFPDLSPTMSPRLPSPKKRPTVKSTRALGRSLRPKPPPPSPAVPQRKSWPRRPELPQDWTSYSDPMDLDRHIERNKMRLASRLTLDDTDDEELSSPVEWMDSMEAMSDDPNLQRDMNMSPLDLGHAAFTSTRNTAVAHKSSYVKCDTTESTACPRGYPIPGTMPDPRFPLWHFSKRFPMPPQRGVRMAVDALEPAAGMPSPPDMEESTIEPAMDVAESAQHTSPNKCLKRYDSVTDLRGKKVIDATGEASFEVNDGIDAARDASEVHGILTDLEMAVIQRNYQEDLARKQHRSRDIGDEGLDLEDRLAMEEAFLEPWSNESANDESDQMSGSGDEDQ